MAADSDKNEIPVMPSAAERRIRASFPFIRLLQDFMPRSLSPWLLKRSMARLQLESGITRQELSAGGVTCQWIIPQGSASQRVLLYLHGGGFVYGLTPQHMHMVATLARKMGTRALMVDYRLAPAHPFPAALDDCVTVYRWLLQQGFRAQDLVVAGDSAGGNLAITSMMKLRDSGDPLPAAVACLSPVGDLSGVGDLPEDFKDPLLPRKAVLYYNQSYVAKNDPHDPLISPVFGDWRGLPPLLIHVGEDELLRQGAVRMAGLAQAAGVDVRLEIYPRMWHVWQLFLSLPQAIQSLDDITQFLTVHLERTTQEVNWSPG